MRMRAASLFALIFAIAMLMSFITAPGAAGQQQALATPTALPTPEPGIEPAAVVINVTRCWPTFLAELIPASQRCLLNASAPVWVIGPEAPLAATHLSSDRGGNLALALVP